MDPQALELRLSRHPAQIKTAVPKLECVRQATPVGRLGTSVGLARAPPRAVLGANNLLGKVLYRRLLSWKYSPPTEGTVASYWFGLRGDSVSALTHQL